MQSFGIGFEDKSLVLAWI